MLMTNLTGANLEWANLMKVNLELANLRWANLEGANLEGAGLEGAHYLSFDQFSKVKTLRNAKLGEELRNPLIKENVHLFKR